MSRLTAKNAAEMVEVRQSKEHNKIIAARVSERNAKQIDRLWKAQQLACIRAAMEGNNWIDIKKKLLRPGELHRLGFNFFYVDIVASQLERETWERAALARHQLREKERQLVLEPLEDEVFRLIDEFVASESDKLGILFESRTSAAKELVSCVEAYKAQVRKNGYSASGLAEMFSGAERLDDDDAYFYDSKIDGIEDAVHKLIDRATEFNDKDEDELEIENSEDSADNGAEGLNNRFLIKRAFNERTLPDCLEIDDSRNFFRIEWDHTPKQAMWNFADLFVPDALAWLCAEAGQVIFSAIERQIEKAIQNGRSSTEILSRSVGKQQILKILGREYHCTPTSEQMLTLLGELGFRCAMGQSDTNSFEIQINW